MKNLRVRAGSDKYNSGGVSVQVLKIIQNGNYNGTTFDYDISLLKLERNFKFSSKINSALLPLQNALLPNGTLVKVTGFGSLRSLPNTLSEVEIPLIDFTLCQTIFSKSFTNRMMCAGRTSGKDACQGDIGGPLVFNKTLYGIVSWGIVCGNSQFPGVYTNVSSLTPWIKQNLG